MIERKWLGNMVRGAALAAMIEAPFLAPYIARAQETPDQAYTTALVAEINAARTGNGLHPLGVSPSGREAEVPLQQYLNDLATGRNGIVPPLDYFRGQINIGEMRGVLVGFPNPPGYPDHWQSSSVVDAWNANAETAKTLHDTEANGVVCARSSEEPKFVGCVTFNGPIAE